VNLQAFWLPPECPLDLDYTEETVERGGRTLVVRWPVVTSDTITVLCEYLREQQEKVLRSRSVTDIIDALDRVAEVWLDSEYPPRVKAVDAISLMTGFSKEMVDHSIDLEQRSSRRGEMLAALDNELGDHRALDGFVERPLGSMHAVGPALVGGVFSANIPALPHLTVMRSLMVKAACLGRVSRGEPLYLPLYAESVAAVDPELASCLGVIHWSSDNVQAEEAFLGGIDHLIAYGSEPTIAGLRQRSPGTLRATWHGHRMGFCYLTRGAMDQEDCTELADRVAYDFTVFDQHACLAPQACFVETGGKVSPTEFAGQLVDAMARWMTRLPPKKLSLEEAMALRSARDWAALRVATGDEGVELITPEECLQGSVVVETQEVMSPSPPNRFVRVVPMDDVDSLMTCLRPVRRFLQCAAIEGCPDGGDEVQVANLKNRLAQLGVTRLCAPGQMGTPSMLWHHDGQACLGQLVRWCDEEKGVGS
jgi:hypothetical protein